jgi:hypothetical protein
MLPPAAAAACPDAAAAAATKLEGAVPVAYSATSPAAASKGSRLQPRVATEVPDMAAGDVRPAAYAGYHMRSTQTD